MKILSIIIIFFVTFFGGNKDDKEMNYNPRSLNIEILKLSKNPDFLREEITIEKSLTDKFLINGKFYKILTENNINGYIYIGRVNSCRANGCSVNRQESKSDSYEFFDYFILFNNQRKVFVVKVFNYEATHGQEITVKGWLKQFIDYDGNDELIVGKNIDAISGATISVHGIVNDIQEKTSILKCI